MTVAVRVIWTFKAFSIPGWSFTVATQGQSNAPHPASPTVWFINCRAAAMNNRSGDHQGCTGGFHERLWRVTPALRFPSQHRRVAELSPSHCIPAVCCLAQACQLIPRCVTSQILAAALLAAASFSFCMLESLMPEYLARLSFSAFVVGGIAMPGEMIVCGTTGALGQ